MLKSSSSYRTHVLQKIAGSLLLILFLGGCSTGQMVVRGTQTILGSGVESMNRETDLSLARAAMPANLKLVEGMLIEDPDNKGLLLFAAEGFYGYSYGFIETEDATRASAFYRRCYDYARRALILQGFKLDPESASADELSSALASAGKQDVPAIFWTASCQGKWIDMNRDKLAGISGLGNVAVMMQRVLELDESYYHGAPHLFFGVYYGGRSPLLGGNFELAEQHFQRAAEINDNKLLLVDLLHAEFLDRQQLNRNDFHRRLTAILEAPDNLYPAMALVNGISKQKAARLLTYEDDWF